MRRTKMEDHLKKEVSIFINFCQRRGTRVSQSVRSQIAFQFGLIFATKEDYVLMTHLMGRLLASQQTKLKRFTRSKTLQLILCQHQKEKITFTIDENSRKDTNCQIVISSNMYSKILKVPQLHLAIAASLLRLPGRQSQLGK